MNEYSSVGFQALDMRCPGLNIRASYNLQTKNVDPYNRSFELLTQDLKKMNEIRAVSFCFPVPEQEQGAWQKIFEITI